jgi:DNA-binding CsgD family transcriptional regulator
MTLTPRQREFLALYARGMRLEEIAAVCCVQIGTVKDAMLETRSRLGAKNSAEAVALAIAREELALDHDGVCYVPESV